ncbi:hypothetical protein [Streptomyces lincolnensis]|uniref:hypothetical protein n=1 Tax=Streptomyces lincolnensis TaxID=1915 RepID=UPI0012602841|nr:hypothetical protein [Streptomyces lincolnensis]QMV08288.1 hypothetical protein GJU35_23340 [Streptomyces lincolnensis]
MNADDEVFDWSEIEQGWLGGGQVALPAETIVGVFNSVVSHFGRTWIEASRTTNRAVESGALPTLSIVTLGQRLESLANAVNSDDLLRKLRERQPDASGELTAIHLVRSGAWDVALELEPPGLIPGGNRNPDFRIKQGDLDWTCIEVKQTSTSQARAQAEKGLHRLSAGLIGDCGGNFTLEVFFKREPTPDEVEEVAAQIINLHSDRGAEEISLRDGLGTLYWNDRTPGSLEVDDHGEPRTRVNSMATNMVEGVVQSDIVVRWPFADARAQVFLDSARKQLPTDVPGLVMVDVSGALGAMKTWRAVIERRFQPSMYTRVSGVCLFSSGVHLADGGYEWRPETQLIRNPHARIALPEWIAEQIERFRP